MTEFECVGNLTAIFVVGSYLIKQQENMQNITGSALVLHKESQINHLM